MKRFFALILALVMALSLVACGNQPAEPADSEGETVVDEADVDWSGKTINFYCTHSAGGDTDFYARLLAQKLEKQLGCTVVVTNVTGSNGAVCMTQYKDAPNDDGLTYVCTNCGSLACNEASGITDFGYNALETVAVYGKQANQCIVVRADSPFETFKDFVDFTCAPENEGAMNLGASTGGVAYYLTMVMEKFGCSFNLIDIGDNAERVASLLGGGCDATIVTYSLVQDYVEAGQLKVLCAIPKSNNEGNKLELASAADVIPELIDDSVYACFAPKGTDPKYIQALNEAILACTLTDSEWIDTCASFSFQSPYVLNVEDSVALLDAQRNMVMGYADLLRG